MRNERELLAELVDLAGSAIAKLHVEHVQLPSVLSPLPPTHLP